MNRFIPREKMNKKARKQLDGLSRTTWPFPPTMKKVESKKAYNRHRMNRDL